MADPNRTIFGRLTRLVAGMLGGEANYLSPSGDTTTQDGPASEVGAMDESTARTLIDRYWSAMGNGNFEALGDLFATDVVIEWPQTHERVRGKEACLRVFSSYPGGSPRLVALNRVMNSGSLWITEAEVEYPGDRRYITASVFEVVDGKISHEIDYFAEESPAPAWRSQWVELTPAAEA